MDLIIPSFLAFTTSGVSLTPKVRRIYFLFNKNSTIKEQFQISEKDCCILKNQSGSSCNCDYMSLTASMFIEHAAHLIVQSFNDIKKLDQSKPINFTCQKTFKDEKSAYDEFIAAMVANTAGKS